MIYKIWCKSHLGFINIKHIQIILDPNMDYVKRLWKELDNIIV